MGVLVVEALAALLAPTVDHGPNWRNFDERLRMWLVDQ
jgi:hypothetical protein